MSTPPIDGPMIRLPLTIDEFSAIAFGRSARSSTISTTNAWRAGVSNALMTPCTTCSSEDRPHGDHVPDSVSTASASDCSIDRTCVTTRMRWRSQRSTSTPANGASEQRRNLAAEADDAEQQLGAGQAVDEPARGDAGDPRADERDALAAEEEAVVAMSKGAGEPAGSDHAPYCCRSGCSLPSSRARAATLPAARPVDRQPLPGAQAPVTPPARRGARRSCRARVDRWVALVRGERPAAGRRPARWIQAWRIPATRDRAVMNSCHRVRWLARTRRPSAVMR